MKQRIVCIFAHPDDEAFGPAGTIAKLAKENEVYLLCVTKGNYIKTKDPDRLGKVREEELKKSAKILGVKKVECLGFDDGCLCNNVYHELAAVIEKKLRQYKPDTLMTFELNGVSGHVDHITVSLVTTYIFWRLPFVRRLLYFCEPNKIVDSIDDYFIYMPPGYDRTQVDMAVDISSYWNTKVAAMKAHASQKGDCDTLLRIYTKLGLKEEYFLEVNK